MAVLTEEAQPLVSVDAQLDQARFLLSILKAIHIHEDVVLVMGKEGLKFVSEDAKAIQANAYIQADLFSKYVIKTESESSQNEEGEEEPAQASLRLHLPTLIDCLALQLGGGSASGSGLAAGLFSAVGGASSVAAVPGAVICLRHESAGPLRLWLEEGGVVTEVRARGRDPGETMDFEFAGDGDVAGKVYKYTLLVTT